MVDFKKIELSDKGWIDPLIAAADNRACHVNFTNMFSWYGTYKYHVAQAGNFLLVKGSVDDIHRYYFYPTGVGDVAKALEVMKQDADNCGHPFQLFGLSPENMETMTGLYPGKLEFEEMRDSFDYLYYIEKMITLSGNKLHGKRNHINKFKATHDNWKTEVITADNLAECWEMNNRWCELNEYEDEDILLKEKCAVKRCFESYDALGLEGLLLRDQGKVIAYTVGEKLNSDTYDIHIEKAFSDIQGAYQMINREFAEFINKKYPALIYVNREEDMGFEGLRKAKLSYKPDLMEEKYIARLKD